MKMRRIGDSAVAIMQAQDECKHVRGREARGNVWRFQETNQIEFLLNGNKITVDTRTISPKTTLNDYLRNNLHLKGTKYMCKEGGCGSCIVTATFTNPQSNTRRTKAVNSCLVTVLMVGGWEITTVEGVGSRATGYNEIQQKIVQYNATQCGFCTPGWVMAMYALKQSGPQTMAQIENSFGSNLCRCTGYRPLLTGLKTMASDADEAVLGLVPDIEELGLCAKKDCCGKKCELREKCDVPLILTTGGQVKDTTQFNDNWYKVTEVKDIFNVFQKNAGRTYQLVAGNTAKGVYKDMADKDYYIDVFDVAELRGYSHSTSVLSLGGNVTLNEAMDIFYSVAQSDDGYAHLAKVANHIDLVAHVAVRNIGTMAGNLSIKHTHKEFPSDIFLLLETIGAVLVINSGNRQRKMSPDEYLDFDMDRKIIYKIEIPPLDATYRFESYKIMKRAQNAHAIINAGFLLKFRSNVVEKCTMVYGGVNDNFVHAFRTEELVTGMALFDNGNMQKFFAKLYSEVQPDDVLPQPLPEFRRQLCVSLFYKYILSIAPGGLVSAPNKSGGPKLIRPPVSNGVQDYTTNASMYPIGEPIHKLEAADQAAGEAEYVTDLEDHANQLFAVFVQGKAAPGSVLTGIDAENALKVEGVEGFFQEKDIPGVNSFMIPLAAYETQDEYIFLAIGQKIQFYNQPIGMIVATSQHIAEEAAEMVKVTFNPATTAPVLTVEEAMGDSTRVKPFNTWLPTSQNPNVPVKFQGSFNSLFQYHNYMELIVASVKPEDNESYTVNVGTQWMDIVQSSICRSMNIPAHKINVNVKRVGGSYGGKINRANWVACAATLAASKLRKPVKFYLSLQANMDIIGKRHNMSCSYDIGVDDNGVVGYLNNNMYSNTGISKNAAIESFMYEVYAGPYVTDAYSTDIDMVNTDLTSCTYMRAPGYMEGSAMIEYIMDHIGCKLNKDPVDVRLANIKNDDWLKKMINDALDWSDYRNRRTAIDQFNSENTWRKKGISLVPMLYTLTGYIQYYAQVSVYASDGTVAVSHGGTELGQGINTKVAQVTAYIFGIDISMVTILPSSNFIAPNNFTTGGSVTSESVCIALQEACTNLLGRINDAANAAGIATDTPWPARVQNAFWHGVPLTESGSYSHPQDNSTFYSVYGVGVSEIELDVLTGQIVIQRADLLEDTGNSLNPQIEIGQVEGAYVMAAGHWTSEEIIYDDQGALMTNNTWEYKVPGAKDIPVELRVKLPQGSPNPLTPYKNKACSEPPFCLAFTVPLAIKHALQSVRTQFDPTADPWATMTGPCSVEWIYLNSNHNITQYKL